VSDLGTLGRVLIGLGALLLAAGVVVLLAGRIPFLSHLGRLPGDIVIRRDGVTIYIPIVTSLLVSLFLTILLSVLFRR
jgi:hypothetical protein